MAHQSSKIPKFLITAMFIICMLSFSVTLTCRLKPTTISWPRVAKDAKPWTYWWWMGNAVDKANLTELLEMYHKAGLGGVHIVPIYGVKGFESQFKNFLSPEWMALLNHTVSKANRLKMGVDMTTGTGWPFGGPHVQIENAAKMVIIETDTLQAGESLSAPLTCREEKHAANAQLTALMAYSNNGEKKDLNGKVDTLNILNWVAPEGRWILYSVFVVPTGQQVKRAAPGGEGLVMDYFSESSLAHYLTRFDTAFSNYNGRRVRAFYNDSYEVYNANWTVDFFHKFELRRGYDLREQLPALHGEGPSSIVRRVKSDYRETMSDLLLEEFTQPWVKWCHELGSVTRNQAHGSPSNLLDLYAAADIPETEIFGPSGFKISGLRIDPDFPDRQNLPDPLMLKFASSAAHVTGKQLVSSETCTWLGEHFKVALSQAKPEIDQLFVSGINHVFYHGIAYSPIKEPWPGWLFYASTNFGPSNSFWRDFPELNSYITRCQSFLQKGKPDNDVLVYFPMYDIWAKDSEMLIPLRVHNLSEWLYGSAFHKVINWMWQQGFTFDYISDRQLADVRVASGQLISHNVKYKTIVVPKCEFIPLQTLAQLIGLARSGASVIFHDAFPQDVPGLYDLKRRQTQFAELTSQCRFSPTESPTVQTALVENGRMLVGNDLGKMLAMTGVKREKMRDKGLEFIRRSSGKSLVYFITNLQNRKIDEWITISKDVKSCIIFDPRFKRQGFGAIRHDNESEAQVYLQLCPGESVILQFSPDKWIVGSKWQYTETSDKDFELSGKWHVEFLEGGPVTPPEITIYSLRSWTTFSDSNATHFAGTARYSILFDLPSIPADDWVLDLGKVCESARVWLNSDYVGSLWCLPFRISVGDFLKIGENTLDVEVTNLAANRIADLDRRRVLWKKFYNINFVNIQYRPFDASGWEPVDSGLLGPVKLIPASIMKMDKQLAFVNKY